jgi:putative hydrolase of the HAD superfamily
MLPDAILFDAGGTLVLQDPVRIGERLDHPVDPDSAFQAHYRAMAEFSRLRLDGEEHTWDWWLERYFTLLGHPSPASAGKAIDRGYGLWSWAIPGVADGIEALRSKGVRVAVISNSDGSVEGSLGEAGLASLFEEILDSEVVGVKKPDPGIFHLALERLGMNAASTWYVGDSEYHDVAGALSAGLARALLIDPLDLHPTVSDRIKGVADLPALMV